MKKITSVLLAFTLLISLFTLTACEKQPKELLDDAQKILSENPYTITMKMNFSSDDTEMNEIFKMMDMEIPVTVDGDNISMDMSMDLMEQTMSIEMTLVDKVLYYNLKAGDTAQKMKATLTDEQLKTFKEGQSAEMPVDYSQFAELKSEKKDGKNVITCTGINEEGKKALNDQMAASVESLGGTVELGDFSYVITLNDNKYEAMALSCNYIISIEDESFSVDMTMNAAISYDASPITAPADAESYTSVDAGDLIGG